MTRAELSAGSGLSRRKIAKFERGRGPVTDGDRRALAAALDVEIEELIPPIPEPETTADAGADSEVDTDAAADVNTDDTTTVESSDAPVTLDDVEPASDTEAVEATVATDTTVATEATDPIDGTTDTHDDEPEPAVVPGAADADADTGAHTTEGTTDPAAVAPETAAAPLATTATVEATDEITDAPDAPEIADIDADRGTLPGVAPDALLREYLSMLLELRDTQRISPTSLRQEDLSELATALGGTPEAIEARLMELLGTDEQEAWQLRTTILPSLGAASSRR